MKHRTGQKISLYLLRSVGPYVLFSWVLLSVILFVQQAGRFADIFFSANIPPTLVWQLAIALIPNVVAFTCPMAVLVGVIIGLSKMQGDSELIAIRAAGVGNFQIAIPIALLGVALSIFAFIVNIFGVPLAARIVRTVALQTAIYKLESPIEPGVFNTEIAGYTVYVKDGDITTGAWKNIFIHAEDAMSGTMRLITSSDGRIDATGEKSELVLANAVSSTFTKSEQGEKYVSEKLREIRFAINTRRGELIEKFGNRELTVEELGLGELANVAATKVGSERTEANIVWQRRLVLSIAPFLFALLGTVLVLRFNRGGRGFGILLSLVSLISFYLLAFLGEQIARTTRTPAILAAVLPIGAAILAIIWFSLTFRFRVFDGILSRLKTVIPKRSADRHRPERRNLFMDLTTGLRDFDLILNLVRYFAIAIAFLAAIFVVFTAFELWRFAGTTEGGIWLLAKYLFFLLPFVYLSLAPSAAMIATLATYVIKSRQNEIVTWIAAGQSIYRLLFPCFALMCFLGFVNWQIQERIAPNANMIQDQLRNQIRSRGKIANLDGKYWVANDRRIYSFGLAPKNDSNNSSASDNGTAPLPIVSVADCALRNLVVYEFVNKGQELQTLYRAERAVWQEDRIRFEGPVTKSKLSGGNVESAKVEGGEIMEAENPFLAIRKKPSQLSTSDIRQQINSTESEIEQRSFRVALEKRYSTLFLPLIIALFTAPFALSLNRKGKAVTVGYAVALWLLFMGVTSSFEQLGLSGTVSPILAVWVPLGIFAALGGFLLSRVRT